VGPTAWADAGLPLVVAERSLWCFEEILQRDLLALIFLERAFPARWNSLFFSRAREISGLGAASGASGVGAFPNAVMIDVFEGFGENGPGGAAGSLLFWATVEGWRIRSARAQGTGAVHGA